MIKRKLMPLHQWVEERFIGDPPTMCTLRRLCVNGELPAKKIGRKWYIDVEAEVNYTGDELADNVLKGV
ncbi:helix-turn-helix domain-containing protein [Oceanospirillum sediminis]|uniref:DNA-binding protein n=1 Tax=Oceanospirillum sediminis TaxID=2760088 RepID=A0A839IM87_9GAMM|nr:helix-turn-helix domain-containing protein [Oceanospirillum sediminis]MBB1485830.1 DNA-binding protein [Oceanospirillum sediminis]